MSTPDYLTLCTDGILSTLKSAKRRTVVDSILAAAPTKRMQGKLFRILLDDPRALTSGSSTGAPIVTRLARALIERRVNGVVLPRCGRCQRPVLLEYVDRASRICRSCFASLNTGTCCRCGNDRPIAYRDGDSPVCGICRSQEVAETCQGCLQVRPVARRVEGSPFCQVCYDRPQATCSGCGATAPIHSSKTGRPICKICYDSAAAPNARHGRVKRVPRRRCTCSHCGKKRLCADFATAPVCADCSGRQAHECARCQRRRPVQAVLPEGSVCTRCYDVARNEMGSCELCGAHGWILHVAARVLCAGCAGVTDFRCKSCGGQGRFYEKNLCASCVCRRRLSAALEKAGKVPPQLSELVDALSHAPNPRVIINWLARSEGARLLADLAKAPEITHELLDEMPQTKWLSFLRNLLVHFSALPERNVEFTSLELWLKVFLREYTARIATSIRMFAEWQLFRRLRRKAAKDRLTIYSAKWARMRLRMSATFLVWLDDQGKSLADCRQSDVDDWLSSGNTTKYLIRDFLVWASARGFTSDLRVPRRKVLTAASPIDSDAQWEAIDRLFLQAGIPVRDRVAGLFVLLFAQNLTRIQRLTTEHILLTSDGVTCAFGKDPVVLPELLGSFIFELQKAQESNPKARRRDGTFWLFTGRTPGRPIDIEILRKSLQRYGIVLRSHRKASQLQLASIAPAILAGTLGMHINTAVKLHRTSRSSRHRYAAKRRPA